MWIFSRRLVEDYENCRCLQEQAAESSVEKNSDGERSARSRSTNTPDMYSSHGKTTDRSIRSRFGMTCERLTDGRGEELLMWFLGGSRARTSASPEPVKVSKENAPGSGRKWRELSARYDRVTSGWKTHRCLFEEDLPPSSLTLPRWGMMRDGVLWERTTPELPTGENASGYWPTPTVRGNTNMPKQGTKRGTGLATAVRTWPMVIASARHGWSRRQKSAIRGCRIDDVVEREAGDKTRLNPDWCEWLMGWPVGWTRLDPMRRDAYDYDWSVDPADIGKIPRTTIERTHRSHRIRCIGNGQVPQAVEFAWRLLNDKTE